MRVPEKLALASPVVLALALACGRDEPAPPPTDERLAWAEVLERAPDATVVGDADLRERIAATGLPWRVRELKSGVELLLVPPGESLRGAPPEDAEAFADERPQHAVRVVEPFYLGRYELTQGEWERVLGTNPSHFSGEPRRPVEFVSRFDVQEFLGRTGLDLPTEAQWEHACRAGDPRPRHGEIAAVAWYRANAGHATQPVGAKAANALGFHDMLGNVWEWTSSWYLGDEYARRTSGIDARTEPRLGASVVLRGGSWYDAQRRVRASARYSAVWTFSAGHVGVRVAKQLAPLPPSAQTGR